MSPPQSRHQKHKADFSESGLNPYSHKKLRTHSPEANDTSVTVQATLTSPERPQAGSKNSRRNLRPLPEQVSLASGAKRPVTTNSSAAEPATEKAPSSQRRRRRGRRGKGRSINQEHSSIQATPVVDAHTPSSSHQIVITTNANGVHVVYSESPHNRTFVAKWNALASAIEPVAASETNEFLQTVLNIHLAGLKNKKRQQ